MYQVYNVPNAAHSLYIRHTNASVWTDQTSLEKLKKTGHNLQKVDWSNLVNC